VEHVPEAGEHNAKCGRAMFHTAGAHAQACHQHKEPPQREQREHIHDARAFEPSVWDDARKRQRKQQPAERRANRVRKLEDRPAPRNSVHKMLFRNKMGDER